MPCVTRKKICHGTIKQAFDIVKDFKSYPEFLPWCSGARLRSHSITPEGHESFVADLIISYKIFSENFTTQVVCNTDNHHIDIMYVKGPFKHLKSFWKFHPVLGNPLKTEIEFMIDFEFKSGIFQNIISLFFEEAMRRMISAFDERLQSISSQ